MERPLPGPVLEKVFHHLSAFQLTRARLVCRAWNETICESRPLLKKFVFLVNHAGICGKNCQQCRILANARGRLINVMSRYALMQQWCLVGEHLQRLTLECCYGIKVDRMIDMLRNVRNLQSLTLRTMFLEDFKLQNVKLDFKMEKLTELKLLDGQIPVKYLYIFKKICVRLVKLSIADTIHWKSNSDHWKEQLLKLIYHVRDSLEDLTLSSLYIRDSLLKEISSIDRLELKKISLQKCEKLSEHDIFTLTRLQPALKHLEVQSVLFRDEKVLIEVCQNLSNLTCIKLETIHLSETSWLRYIPTLVHLELNSCGSPLDFENVTFPNLHTLSLKRVLFPPASLQKIFKNVPNLHNLTLSSCILQNVPDLLASLHHLQHLQHLTLKHFPSLNDRYPQIVPHNQTNLRRLDLVNVFYFPLQPFCKRYPRLQAIHLERTTGAVDRQLQLAWRELRQLKELSLQELVGLTESFVELVCVQRRTLERISVVQCPLVRYRARNRLNFLRERIQVTC